MARFDFYQSKINEPYLLLDVQSETLSDYETRVVIPLIPFDEGESYKATRLNPVFAIEDTQYVLMTSSIASVDRKILVRKLGNLEAEHFIITAAIDFLLQGF